MATMARAEPSSVVTALTDGDATQVSADTKHDEPLGLLGTCFVGFRIAKRLDVNAVGLLNLLRGTVANEDWLAAPFDDDVLACLTEVQGGRWGVIVSDTGPTPRGYARTHLREYWPSRLRL